MRFNASGVAQCMSRCLNERHASLPAFLKEVGSAPRSGYTEGDTLGQVSILPEASTLKRHPMAVRRSVGIRDASVRPFQQR